MNRPTSEPPSDAYLTEATEVLLPGIVEPEGMQLRVRQLPAPGRGEVEVAVEATGISFAEQQMRRAKYYNQPPFPFVPGYDLIGTVTAVGPGVDPTLVGQRHAAITKVGAWASHTVLEVGDLTPVPDGVDAGEAETFLVNGVTAWRMLHVVARVRPGGTILVLGANGGVGTTLVQLARQHGIRVIGTASTRHHELLRELGAEPVDRAADVPAQVRTLAPVGVDAVFDHVGGPGIVDSYRLLAPRGTLVAYGSASTRDDPGSSRKPVLLLFTRLTLWNLLPNGHRATFFNVWAGARRRARFRASLSEDLARVLELLRDGDLAPQVAARFSLDQIAEAMRLAESGTVVGKVILHPTTS